MNFITLFVKSFISLISIYDKNNTGKTQQQKWLQPHLGRERRWVNGGKSRNKNNNKIKWWRWKCIKRWRWWWWCWWWSHKQTLCAKVWVCICTLASKRIMTPSFCCCCFCCCCCCCYYYYWCVSFHLFLLCCFNHFVYTCKHMHLLVRQQQFFSIKSVLVRAIAAHSRLFYLL